MHTVNLKITASGALSLAHPYATSGPDTLTYAINRVPADVLPADVLRQVSRLCLAHRVADVSAWSYDWAELAGLAPGRIVNRYRAR